MNSPETYEDFVTIGQELAQTKDKMQWGLGDLANLFMGTELVKQGKRGEKTLKEFANDAGVASRSMQEYYSMANFYPPEYRALFAPTITYTHARIAKSYGKNLGYAMELLEDAAHKSTDEFTRFLKAQGETVQPKPDDMIRLPRLLLIRAVGMLRGELALENELINQLEEYLQ